MTPTTFDVVALDPSETWELDFSRRVLEQRVEIRRAVEQDLSRKADAGDAAAAQALEPARAARDAAERELAFYEPGSGPVFVVGHIPGARRAALDALSRSVRELADVEERAAADFRWAREVVRWAVRGHRGLRRRDGGEVPFSSEPLKFDGEDVQVVSRATLDVYAASRLLGELALFVVLGQQLDEARKNG